MIWKPETQLLKGLREKRSRRGSARKYRKQKAENVKLSVAEENKKLSLEAWK